jgi:hypothetical protein
VQNPGRSLLAEIYKNYGGGQMKEELQKIKNAKFLFRQLINFKFREGI